MSEQKRKSCQTAHLATILITFIVTSMPLYAESPQEMTKLAQDYLLTNLDARLRNPTIHFQPLSATAQTPKCTEKVTIRWNSGQKTGNISLSLMCTNPKWQRYVNAKISGELPVIMTNKDLALGSKITKDDIYIAWLPDAQVRKNHLTNLSDIENISTRQFISSGSALTNNQVRASVLINKGDRVRIIAISDNINIEMPGIALESGEKGKSIRVQNLSSGKNIKGNILSADSVLVP